MQTVATCCSTAEHVLPKQHEGAKLDPNKISLFAALRIHRCPFRHARALPPREPKI